MNDSPRRPTPEDEVRALLGEIGSGASPEQMPDDVTARLEETLAGLAAERTVVPLRRRWAPRLAAAAAAVIVLGVGGVTVANLGLLDGSGDGGTSAGTTADSDTAVEQAPEAAPAPALSSSSFGTDVTMLLQRMPSLAAPPGVTAREQSGAGLPPPDCPGPREPRNATRLLIRLDGEPAVLLVRSERAGRRLVQAWSCDGTRTLASARLGSGTLSP